MVRVPHVGPRLRAIVTAIGDSESVADIGYNHAHVLLALLHAGRRGPLIGIDPDPHCIPAVHARHADAAERLDLRCGYGLHNLRPGEVAALVIAGMGEIRIREILSAGWEIARQCQRIVVCPARLDRQLIPWLAAHDWHLHHDIAISERKHIYGIWVFQPGGAVCQLHGTDSDRARWQARLDNVNRHPANAAKI